MKIRFISIQHQEFYQKMIQKSKIDDCYHRAFFYLMGIASDTRGNINRLFNFEQDSIEPSGACGGWLTSETVRICYLAFNLWNGYMDLSELTPDKLFCSEYALYFMEGIKLRHPDYCEDEY